MIRAVDTSGRAVLFAGTTVLVSILGLLFIGQSVIRGVAIAIAIGVFMTMVASVTLLPALLGFVGTQHRPPRPPHRGRREATGARVRLVPVEPGAAAQPVAAAHRSGSSYCSCSPPRPSRCASGSPTRATSRRATPRARPTTCSRAASARASTGRSSSRPRPRTARRTSRLLGRLSGRAQPHTRDRVRDAAAAQRGGHGGDHAGVPDDRAAGRGDGQPGLAPARRHRAAGDAGTRT